jgi:hypothetical protein
MQKKMTTSSGSKDHQRDDWEDRAAVYRNWRYKAGLSRGYVADIDQLEYRFIDGVFTPIALLELTRVDDENWISPQYLNAITERFKRDGQGKVAREVASLLGLACEAWIVLFRKSLSEFWIYNLTLEKGWVQMSQVEYRNWLNGNCQSSVLSREITTRADVPDSGIGW